MQSSIIYKGQMTETTEISTKNNYINKMLHIHELKSNIMLPYNVNNADICYNTDRSSRFYDNIRHT